MTATKTNLSAARFSPVRPSAGAGAASLRCLPVAAVGVVLLSCPLLFAAPNAVNVRDTGAVGDGRTDDTESLLKAIVQAEAQGTSVFVPRGTYRVSRPLSLTRVALTGPSTAAWPADTDPLPTFVPSHRDGPVFVLGPGGGLGEIDITYHWETEPESGPPAVLISGIGAYIRNVRIRYPWDGIVTDGQHNVGRLNLENVFLVSPRNVGVRVTGTWDISRVCNVEVWNAGPVKRGLTQGVGFLLGKNDLIHLTDCSVFGMSKGFLLADKLPGCKITGGTWGVMNGCATDFCVLGIAVQGNHSLSVSGGTFWDHGSGLLVDGEGARVRLSGSELQSNGAPAVHVVSCNQTVVTGCSLLRPMKDHPGPLVVLEGGAVLVQGCSVTGFGDAFHLEKGLRGAVVQGNMLATHGHAGVVDHTGGGPRFSVQGNAVVPPAPKQEGKE